MADSSRIRTVINHDGLYQLRVSDKVKADLEKRAHEIADKCNREAHTDGFKTSSVLGHKSSPDGGRWRTTVITARAGAIRHNAAHQTLINNMDAGSDG